MSGAAERAPARRALLLIDFQRDFLRDDGRMPVAADQREPVVAAANRAVAAARAHGDVIIAIGNAFRRGDWSNLFRRFAAIEGSDGARWDERVATGGAPYFAKWQGSAFCNADLALFLDGGGVKELALAGVYASACVSATARDALGRGFPVTVLADAVADRSEAARKRALAQLARIGAAVVTTREDDVLRA